MLCIHCGWSRAAGRCFVQAHRSAVPSVRIAVTWRWLAQQKGLWSCGTSESPTTCTARRVSGSYAPVPVHDNTSHACACVSESNALGLDSGLRKPSYSTDNMAMVAGVNGAGIVQVKAFTAAGAGATPGASGKGSDEKMSFQIASLDDRGTLVFWVVVELSANDLYVRPACVLQW